MHYSVGLVCNTTGSIR